MASARKKDDDDDDFPIVSSFKKYAGVRESDSLKSIVCDDRNVVIHFTDQLAEVNAITECLLEELEKCEDDDKKLMHRGKSKGHKHGVLKRTPEGEFVFTSEDIDDQPKEDCLICQLLSLQERIDNVVVDRLNQSGDPEYLRSILKELKDFNSEQNKLDDHIESLLRKLNDLEDKTPIPGIRPSGRRVSFGEIPGERTFDDLEEDVIPDVRRVGDLISDIESGYGYDDTGGYDKVPPSMVFEDQEGEKYAPTPLRPWRKYDADYGATPPRSVEPEEEYDVTKPLRPWRKYDADYGATPPRSVEPEEEYVVTKPCECGTYCTCAGKKGQDCVCYDDLFNLVKKMNAPILAGAVEEVGSIDSDLEMLKLIATGEVTEEEPDRCCERDYPHIHTVYQGEPMVLRLTSVPPPEEEEPEVSEEEEPEPEVSEEEELEPEVIYLEEPEPEPVVKFAEPEPEVVVEEESLEEEEEEVEEEEEEEEGKSCNKAILDFWRNTIVPMCIPICLLCNMIRMEMCNPDKRKRPRNDLMYYT